MFNGLFKKTNYGTVKPIPQSSLEEKPNIPSGMWLKCNKCGSIIYNEDLASNCYVCSSCGNHLRINAHTRISLIFDKNSFVEIGREIRETNPLSFEGYEEKIEKAKKTSGSSEAVITGFGK